MLFPFALDHFVDMVKRPIEIIGNLLFGITNLNSTFYVVLEVTPEYPAFVSLFLFARISFVLDLDVF